jgi:membrane protease YdiL (CAAX protease family)
VATTLTVARAGLAEEVFYRGYAIERLEALLPNRWLAALIPLLCFTAFHYRQGLAGVFVALVLGAILTALYLWKRNLIANIIAHFLVDFIPNVLLPLLAGE